MKITYGCDCDCGNHQGMNRENVPVAVSVERDGKIMNVCTRCDLSSDKVLKYLFDENTLMQPFADFDPLGALCMIAKLHAMKEEIVH